MPFILNTLPKAGTNFLIAWLQANEFNLRASISPTRFLGPRQILPRLFPQSLKSTLFFDIGLENEALYDFVSFRKKLNKVRKHYGDYITAHIQYSPIAVREITRQSIPVLYVTRDHLDVLNSYSNYVASTKSHVHHKLFNEIGERNFLDAMVQGRRVGGVQFRRFFDELKRFDQWKNLPGALTLNYTDYCNSPDKTAEVFQNEFEDKFKFSVRKCLSSVYGKSHTFHRGGNDGWKRNSVLLDVISESSNVGTN